MEFAVLSKLSDDALLAALRRLATGEREIITDLVAHLGEMDSRRLHLAAGFPSLFAYCTGFLRLSEYEAFNRIEAARAARRFPRVLAMLADGSLTLTTAQLLSRHLTDENQDVLLAGAAGKSKLEVQELIVRHEPKPDVPASVRRLPAPVVAASVSVECPATPSVTPTEASGPPTRFKPPVTPLAPDRYLFTFTGSRETRELLEHARDLLRHAVPNGDTAEIMNRALKSLVRDLKRKKFAVTVRPRKSRGPRDPQDPSAQVKRDVFARDDGRCRYVAPGGRRCNERAFAERHHVIARGKGTRPSVTSESAGREVNGIRGTPRRATGRQLGPERVHKPRVQGPM